VPIHCPTTNYPSLIIILVGSSRTTNYPPLIIILVGTILSKAPQEGKDTENEEEMW
jgi:hypothetical protein